MIKTYQNDLHDKNSRYTVKYTITSAGLHNHDLNSERHISAIQDYLNDLTMIQ